MKIPEKLKKKFNKKLFAEKGFLPFKMQGRFATGRLEVGPAEFGGNNAGINGSGTAGTSVRFWGGGIFNDAIAGAVPFRVLQDGTIYAFKGVVGGWTIETDGIYTGTKKISDGYSASGITMAGNGSIHATRFYINQDGSIAIRSAVSGRRIEIDSNNNRIDIYNASNINVIQIEANVDWGMPEIRLIDPFDPTNAGAVLAHFGLVIREESNNKIQIEYSGGFDIVFKDLPTGGSNLKALYVDTVTGKIHRAT